MIEVVKTQSLTISMPEAKLEGLSICIRCKGEGVVAVTDCSGNRRWSSGYFLIYHHETCPLCRGRRFYWRGG